VYFEDFQIGQKFTTESRTVSQEDIDRFADLTGDYNKIHLDAEYAKQTMFGGTISHGLLTISMSLGLWFDLRVTNDSIITFLGLDDFVFRAPVRPGDNLQLSSEVVSKRESKSHPDAGIVTFNDQISNGMKIVVEGRRTFLLQKRAKSETA
jgi:acyl dehydratase